MIALLIAVAMVAAVESAGALVGEKRGVAVNLLRGAVVAMPVVLVLTFLPRNVATVIAWIVVAALIVHRLRTDRKLHVEKVVPACLLAVSFLGYAALVLAQPLDTIDFRSYFGLRARHLLLADEGALALLDVHRTAWHGHYPPGLPILYAGAAMLFGEFDERALSVVPLAAAAALFLAFLRFVRERDLPEPLATLWSAVVALAPALWAATEIGHAEVPLAAAVAVAVAAIYRGDAATLRWAAVAMSLLKNEGLTFAALLLLADLVVRRRLLAAHALALAPGLAWLAIARATGFPSADTGPLPGHEVGLDAVMARLPHVLDVLGQVLVHSVSGPLFLLLPLALVFARKGRWVAAAVAAQVGLFTVVYLTTPSNAMWLMWLSVERVLAPLALAAAMTLAALGREGDGTDGTDGTDAGLT